MIHQGSQTRSVLAKKLDRKSCPLLQLEHFVVIVLENATEMQLIKHTTQVIPLEIRNGFRLTLTDLDVLFCPFRRLAQRRLPVWSILLRVGVPHTVRTDCTLSTGFDIEAFACSDGATMDLATFSAVIVFSIYFETLVKPDGFAVFLALSELVLLNGELVLY